MDKNILDICWDCETENLNLGLCRPWQLAYIVADKKGVLKEINRYVDIHDLNVGEGAARVTGFSWDKYHSKKVPANDVIDEFEPYLLNENNRLIGHNILGYDIYILKNLYKYAGRQLDFKKIVYRFYDTLAIARAQHFESPPPEGKYDFLAWQYKHLHKFDKSVKTSLGALAKRNDIEVDDTKTHDALYDVTINYKIFKKLQYAIDFL